VNLVNDLLVEVRAGKCHFQPLGTDERDMRSFQLTAKALMHAEARGWLAAVRIHKNARSGEWLIDNVWVEGGLTYKGEIFLNEGKRNRPLDSGVSVKLRAFDEASVHIAWERALARRSSDAAGAITSARTLLETVCKQILDAKSVAYEANKVELHELYKLTAKVLNLSPSDKTEDIYRQIFGGCSAIVNGVGNLRNKLGDAHGKGANSIGPAPHEAELAVNLAGSMALFLVSALTRVEG